MLVNDRGNENDFELGVMTIQRPLLVASQPTKLPPLVARVFCLFISMLKEILAKRKLNLFLVRFEPTTTQLQIQYTTNSTNSCFMIIPIILGLHYHYLVQT